jgi:nucleotide-binding universal stress UspA family protein
MNTISTVDTISRILVPIDFLPHSAEAVRRALDIARHYSAEVVLLHVYQPAEYPLSPGDVVYDERQLELVTAKVRARLDAVRREVDPIGRRRVSTRVLPGIPEQVIVEAAEREAIDLIVMGTRGRTGVDRLIAGSIAEQVMRRAPCAVLTVKTAREAPAHLVARGALAAGDSAARRAPASFFGAPGLAIARAISRPWR